jgi:hypothetical protein
MAKKFSNEVYYERLVSIVVSKGGQVISKEYEKATLKMWFSCSDNHIFEKTPNDIQNGYWCKKCSDARNAKKRRLPIESVRKEIESRGGELLSETYVSTGTPLKVRCENGHIFHKDLDHIRRDQWCNECSEVLSPEDIYRELIDIAASKGGRVISPEYKTGKTDMEFECAKGHKFWSRPTHVRNSGTWCKYCSNSITDEDRQERHEELQAMAEPKGGLLLSEEYLGIHEKHHWQCDKGHKFWSVANSVKRGYWCRKCGGTAPLSIEDLQKFAERKGGELLSTEYIDARTDYQWQCAEGHDWWASPANVMKKNGTWCNSCKDGVSERICRRHFELLFGVEFKKRRPLWLKVGERARLELDGYAESLGIAFEYHGEQHYRAVAFSKNSLSPIARQKELDQLKRERCRENGVTLIEVPYTERSRMEDFIRAELNQCEITPPRQERISEVELAEALPKNTKPFLEFTSLVEAKGGTVLHGQAYVDSKTKIMVRCGECGCEWGINLSNLRHNRWCKPCGIKRRSQARRIAKNNTGTKSL